MNLTLLFKNLFAAFVSQGVALICSVITTLAVPKVMGVHEFGYWQYFIFLTSYVSLFQFGVNDGIYLSNGGSTREEIDKAVIKSELFLTITIQSLIAFVIVACSLCFASGSDKLEIILASAVFMVVSNATFLLGYVFQAMNETRLFSHSIVVDRLVYLVPLCLCIFFYITSYYIYIIFYIVARCSALAYCMVHAKDFLSAGFVGLRKAFSIMIRDMKLGLVLSFANICSMMILGIARFLIEARWGIEVFGEISLSLSLINFILLFITQLSMVLFPALRQADETALPQLFSKIRDGALILLPTCFLLYFPVRLFILFWLPQYTTSLKYFVFMMPIVLFEAMADMVYVTFLKVRCEPKKLLLINSLSLLCSVICCSFSCFILNNVYLVIVSAVVGLAIRAYLGDFFLSRDYQSSNFRIIASSIVYVACFTVINFVLSPLLACLVSIVVLFVYLISNRSTFLPLWLRIKVIVRLKRVS